MAFAISLFGGLIGFFAAVLSGLVLGLGWIECFAVYAGTGTLVALSLFTVRGVYCLAARQLA